MKRGKEWEENQTVKKGNLGEALIDEYVEKNGFRIYQPDPSKGSHPVDRFIMKVDKDNFPDKNGDLINLHIIAIEVKTKPARDLYPDTGFDLSSYAHYKRICETYKIRVAIYFVDDIAGKIYGNYFDELEKERVIEVRGKEMHYPFNHNGIRYYPTSAMKTIIILTDEQVSEIKKYSKNQ